MTMRLDLENVAAINELLADGNTDALARLTPTEATLAGLMELGALAETLADSRLQAWVAGHAARWPLLDSIRAALRNRLAQPARTSKLHATPAQEVWPLASAQSLTDEQFTLYLLRFERSLKAVGFPTEFATAVVAAFSEMADNVIQHSGNAQVPVAGIAGFRVSSGAMNYVVADVGQGALSKLRGTSKWGAINSERDALIAVGRDGATSRGLARGSGYYHVFESFLDRQGLVKLRSGDGLAQFTGNLTQRKTEATNSQSITGFRVFVSCALNAEGSELSYGN